MKKRTHLSYSQKMSFLRPMVSFYYKHPDDLSRKNKTKITTYYNALKNLEGKYRVVPILSSRNFEKIRNDVTPTFSTMFEKTHIRCLGRKKIVVRVRHHFPFFKVLFIKDTSIKKLSVEYDRKKRKYFLKEGSEFKEFIQFFPHDAAGNITASQPDLDDFLHDPKPLVSKLVGDYPPGALFAIFNPQDWRFEREYDAGGIAQAVQDESIRYSDPNKGNYNPLNYTWIDGLVVRFPEIGKKPAEKKSTKDVFPRTPAEVQEAFEKLLGSSN